jgi:hypothetical protein
MATDLTINVPDDPRSAMETAAHAEGKTVEELFQEAACRMLKVKGLRAFVAENRAHAEAMGITKADVPRLIAETRRGR